MESPQDTTVLVGDILSTWATLEGACASLLRNVGLVELQVGALWQSYWLLLGFVAIVKAIISINWLLLVATFSGNSTSEGSYWLFVISTSFIDSGGRFFELSLVYLT